MDKRFDVICSGSLMGINYKEIESNSVGNKEDYEIAKKDFKTNVKYVPGVGLDESKFDFKMTKKDETKIKETNEK